MVSFDLKNEKNQGEERKKKQGGMDGEGAHLF